MDVAESLEYCKNILGSRTLVYRAELGIGHSLSAEVGNIFGISLIEEIPNYFVSGDVKEENLLQKILIEGCPSPISVQS